MPGHTGLISTSVNLVLVKTVKVVSHWDLGNQALCKHGALQGKCGAAWTDQCFAARNGDTAACCTVRGN